MPNQYNAIVLEIWENNSEAQKSLPGMDLFPMQREDFIINPDILFVGMNPSFSKSLQNSQIVDTYNWRSNASQTHIDNLIQLEAEARESYLIYFGALRRFADSARAESFEHLDLLPIRHTNQKEIISEHWDASGEPNEIVNQCIDLFKKTILAISPKIIIVANAGAARKIIKALQLEHYDNKRKYRWNDLKHVPFFLSGMLSGQRTLDDFSKDRLIADVHAVLYPPEN
jgi:hypothetical protein